MSPLCAASVKANFLTACFPGIFLNNYSSKHLGTAASQRLYSKAFLRKKRKVSDIQKQPFTDFIIVTLKKFRNSGKKPLMEFAINMRNVKVFACNLTKNEPTISLVFEQIHSCYLVDSSWRFSEKLLLLHSKNFFRVTSSTQQLLFRSSFLSAAKLLQQLLFSEHALLLSS